MTQSLADKITSGGYGLLFYWPAHDQTMAAIWSEPGNPPKLEALIDDRAAPLLARLVAAEELFAHDFSFLDRHPNEEVARIYTRALAGGIPNANAWGLLWIDDSVGHLGGRLLALDRDAIGPLRELLEDRTVVTRYEGSEEATLGNGARYRVRDVAAYYLARIVNYKLAFADDLAERDRLIDGLTAALDRT